MEISDRILDPNETIMLTGEVVIGKGGLSLMYGGKLLIRDATVRFEGGQINDPGMAEAEITFENVEFDGRGAPENAVSIGVGRTRIRNCVFRKFSRTVLRADTLGRFSACAEPNSVMGLVRGLLGVFNAEFDEDSIQLIIEETTFEDCDGGDEAPVVLSTMAMEMPAVVLLRDCVFTRCRGYRAGAIDVANLSEENPLRVIVQNGIFEDCKRGDPDCPDPFSKEIILRGCTYQGCKYPDVVSEMWMREISKKFTGR